MKKLAIIGGTSLLQSTLFGDLSDKIVETNFGIANVSIDGNVMFIQRHGINNDIPPHMINYKANISAINQLGFRHIIALNSVGSLTPKLKPGEIVIPDDYFNLFNIPTFFENELRFTIPGLDQELRNQIIEIAQNNAIPVVEKGTYVQVHGPILETPAEIRFIQQIGDIVGMTMTNEAILAKELELCYAAVCVIDNFANGVTDKSLKIVDIDKAREKNMFIVERLFNHFVEELI